MHASLTADKVLDITITLTGSSKYSAEIKHHIDDARASVKKGDEGSAAKLILELVFLVITPISG